MDRSRLIDVVFLIGIGLKAIDGVIEFVAGLLLLVLHPAQITAMARAATAEELREDPHDLISHLVLHGAATLSADAAVAASVFLLLHGIVKIGIVIALILGTQRLYPLAIIALIGFVVWQVVELVLHPGFGLAGLAAFDVVVIVLTWREWRQHRSLGDVVRSVFARRRGERGGAPGPAVRAQPVTRAGRPGDSR
ncbi:DUF2127 domain-containing protein [Curtobacterium sp. ISL-83]|uniref:DUF2127 domain-containing protein n=1 Tax=Curtobacterium sp. ISL-83 TaxID=2819145 RepID=UPI0027DEC215|nr:DUF2127 domain-containing protein [Curtobacterium sp. ISL-83]